ncbi:SirB2 family protein [Pseudoxanthomonas wuyuanensis]
MIEFYPMIKLVHIGSAVTSGGLFALRGTASLAGMRWPMLAAVRYLNYSIDTVLLTAAMMLLTILPGGVFANGWLAVKIGLLLGYITLGLLAFRRNRSRLSRTLLFASALLAYAQIYFIARTHHPLGALYLLLG